MTAQIPYILIASRVEGGITSVSHARSPEDDTAEVAEQYGNHGRGRELSARGNVWNYFYGPFLFSVVKNLINEDVPVIWLRAVRYSV